jgi:hypothetical protein
MLRRIPAWSGGCSYEHPPGSGECSYGCQPDLGGRSDEQQLGQKDAQMNTCLVRKMLRCILAWSGGYSDGCSLVRRMIR